MTAVSIIIINYETAHLANRCIESLRSLSLPHEIIVVDNPSPAEDWKKLRDVHIIRNERNVGYGAACNVAARTAAGKYLCILNPDTVVPPGSLERWFEATKELRTSGDEVGCTGPALLNENGTLQRSSYRFPSMITYWRYHSLIAGGTKLLRKRIALGARPLDSKPTQVDWIMGAAMLFPRESWERVGGFDEDYFLYAEDTDICRRLMNHGMRVFYLPSVSITHSQGESPPHVRDIAARRLFHGILLFCSKHYGLPARLGVRTSIAADMLIRVFLFIPFVVLFPGRILYRKRLSAYLSVLNSALRPMKQTP